MKNFLLIAMRSACSIAMLCLTAVLVGMIMQPKEIHQKHETAASLVTVEVVPLQRHLDGIDFRVDGEVVPFRSLNLVPEVSGRVVFKSDQCRTGRSVKKGEVLLRIDPVDYQLEVDRLTEAVAQAKSGTEENTVQLENTQKELTLAREQQLIRERELQRYQNTKLPGVYSSTELDSVRVALLSTQETVQKLENQCRVYQTQAARLDSVYRKEKVNLALAKLNLERTEVRAPISGIMTSDSFEVNSYVQKGESAATILDTSMLEIHCNLYMKQIQWIWRSEPRTTEREEHDESFHGYRFPAIPVTIAYDLEGETWVWTGLLQTLNGGGMDAATRMVPCRVTVDAPRAVRQAASEEALSRSVPPPTLLSGMYVSVTVHAKPDIPLYRIPEKALLPGNKIWTATGGKLHQHSVRVATTTPEGVLFYADSEDLKPIDLVVVSPLATPVEGGRVDIARTSIENDLAFFRVDARH